VRDSDSKIKYAGRAVVNNERRSFGGFSPDIAGTKQLSAATRRGRRAMRRQQVLSLLCKRSERIVAVL